MRKRVLSWLLVFAMSLSLLPTVAFATEPVENGVVIEQGTIMQLCEGEGSMVQAKAYSNSQPVASPDIQWSVDNESIVKLSKNNGENTEYMNFYALQTGQATISAKYGEYTDTITVSVSQSPQLVVGGQMKLTVPENCVVEGGDPAIATFAPDGDSQTSYILTGISQGVSYLTVRDTETGAMSSVTVYVGTYYVFFDVGGDILRIQVPAGETPSYGMTPEPPVEEGYGFAFTGWAPQIVPAAGNAYYTAQFERTKLYTIELNQYNVELTAGKTSDTFQLEATSITPDPALEGHTLTWGSEDETIATVSPEGLITAKAAGHTRIYADVNGNRQYCQVNVQSQVNYFTITFNVPGVRTERIVVPIGELPQPTISTDKPADSYASYTFTGWMPEITGATMDTMYTAQYEATPFQYTVVFQNWDGTELQRKQYKFGDRPVYLGANPTRERDAEFYYVFDGWDPELADVTASAEPIIYKAKFSATPIEEVNYTIVISEEARQGYAGETFQLTAETEPLGFERGEFVWWSSDPDIATVDNGGNVTLVGTKDGQDTCYIYVHDSNLNSNTAACEVKVVDRKFNITWVVENDRETVQVVSGAMPVYPWETPAKDGEEGYYFTFDGWEPALAPATKDATYTAIFTKHANLTITMNNTKLDLAPGQTAALEAYIKPEAEADTPVTWTTSNESVATVDEEGNVKAVGIGSCTISAAAGNARAGCEVNVLATKYNITWYVDGSEPYVNEVLEGHLPVYDRPTPTKEADAQYTYTFTGWQPEIKAADDHAAYQAQFERKLRSYEVTWDKGNGEEVVRETYEYGASITPPTDPEKPDDQFNTYEFLGWDPSAALREPVKDPVNFTARYLPKEKNGVFINEEDATLFVGEHMQLTAVAKPSSTAWGWTSSDPAVASVTDEGYVTARSVGAATITAGSRDGKYSDSITITVKEEQFVVIWNVDGQITQELYSKGTTPVFKGSTDKASNNTTHFTFRGWDKPIAPVTTDVTYTAQYDTTTRFYTIKWIVDGNETEEQYTYNAMPEYTGSTDKEGDEEHSYLLKGWNPAITPVTQDATYEAVFDEVVRQYSVTWVVDGKNIQTMWDYGAMPVFDGTPEKAPTDSYSYRFTGWNTQIVPVTETAIYIAQFEQIERVYNITWDVNGVKTTEEYRFGDTPSYKGSTNVAQTDEFTYAFKGWSPSLKVVTEDVTYVAQYEQTRRQYTVTFRDSQNVAISTKQWDYGSTPSCSKPADYSETKNGKTTYYTFSHWNPSITTVTKDANYIAIFTSSSEPENNNGGSTTAPEGYVIATFRNWDREVLEEYEIKAGTTPKYDGDTPTRPMKNGYRYVFTGWSPELGSITEDTVYTAQFERSDSDELVLTTNDISEASKDDLTAYEFDCGTLYITEDGMKALAEYKDKITITVKEDKSGVVTITFAKGSSAKTIKDEIEGLTFLATDLDSGDVVTLAQGTSKSFDVERFSVIARAGAYVRIPGTCKIKTAESNMTFRDVPKSAWYAEYVDFMTAREIMIGTSAVEFSPLSNVSRAQSVVILDRLADFPTFSGGKAFDDVSSNAWYSRAVFWATANDLLPKTGLNNWSPNQAITREDLALLLYNYAEYLGYDVSATTGLGKFKDAGTVTVANVSAMKWAVATGVIKGTTSKTLNPKGATSRAEMAAMMMRFLENLIIPEEIETDD